MSLAITTTTTTTAAIAVIIATVIHPVHFFSPLASIPVDGGDGSSPEPLREGAEEETPVVSGLFPLICTKPFQ
ncbi:hypothetical protein K493DRAFT_356632 [Basidiobolus meristosporus CBS 931.73]|uniref:Uncharacterized protein n=1 Tax=Basidiobolus meristosporus CBS 931.73 TaxID=1314790 RepID=A0A1Y1XZ29_9FUNG|nr:hypothetical protein K493DRAFT_356632 [Basidiobolus meristosporus CBS 931.73]|eukprot:ORX90624.1 hypothetical protein K493DRAFT_356632 [Basidiobolus meristosporus CBS 931.73]